MSNINIDFVGELTKIWLDKKWKFQTQEVEDTAFNRFCLMAERFEADEKKLLIQLTAKYQRYTMIDYYNLLVNAILKIGAENIDGVDLIVVIPLIKKADIISQKPKSGTALIYPAVYTAIPVNAVIAGINVSYFLTPDFDEKCLVDTNKALFLIVDDFIGSGNSALTVVGELRPKLRGQDQVAIIGLVAMKDGVALIEGNGIPVFWSEIHAKGIADNESIVNKKEAYDILDRIWQKNLEVNKRYKIGYEKSESLVTLIRTPNNTLPMYWCGKDRSGSDWPSPFKR